MAVRERRERAATLIKAQHERVPLHFINGMMCEAEGGATSAIQNPATGAAVGRSPVGNARDVERAVVAAREATQEMSAMPPSDRAQMLVAAAEILNQQSENLAILESLQTGKPFRDTFNSDVLGGITHLRHFAGVTGTAAGATYDLGGGRLGFTRRETHEASGVILTWASPLGTLLRAIGPAIASGIGSVIKPPEQAPLAVLRVAELLTQAGLTAGAINVVTGNATTGEALALHDGVSHLEFHGSIETARRVLVSAAKSNLKQVDLHLGGKGAHIVFADANLRAVLGGVWKGIFSARSRERYAGSRVLVHESHYEALATTLVARAKEIVIGDPLDEHTELGPMISEEHMKRVLAYVELGRREGAKLVAGGKREVDGSRSNGFFVQPTIFLEGKASMRLVREEVLGPVLTLSSFKSEDEAVHMANDNEYGLAHAVWTQDLSRGHRVAGRLSAGVVWINDHGRFDPQMPHGGRALSGGGVQSGIAALDARTRTKTVYVSG